MATDAIPNDGLGGKARILVIDDSPIARSLTRKVLERAGFHVTLADSGFGALPLAAGGRFDLVLTDLNMPGMDGFETVRSLRSHEGRGKRTPILALTPNLPVAEQRERCLAEGMDGCLAKPFDAARLVATMRWLLWPERYPEPPAEESVSLDRAKVGQA